MSRLPRVHMNGALYYVTQDAAQEKQLFRKPDDYKTYLDLVNEYRDKYAFKFYAYVLLPSRIHMLIEPSEKATISQIMHDLSSRYSKYANGRYHTNGSLFGGRFKTVIVEKESGYDALLIERLNECNERLGEPRESIQTDFKLNIGLSKLSNDANLNLDLVSISKHPVIGSSEFIARVQSEIKEVLHAKQLEKSTEAVDISPKQIYAYRWTSLAIVGVVCIVATAYIAPKFNHLDDLNAPVLVTNTGAKQIEVVTEVKTPARHKDGSAAILSGTEWDVKLMPMDETGEQVIEHDRLRFVSNQVISDRLASKGYLPTHYTLTINPENGTAVWETMQTSPSGEVVFWRGEWDAANNRMQGVYSRKLADGSSQNFNFVAVSQSANMMRAV